MMATHLAPHAIGPVASFQKFVNALAGGVEQRERRRHRIEIHSHESKWLATRPREQTQRAPVRYSPGTGRRSSWLCLNLDTIGVQRPIAKALCFTEPPLGEFCRVPLVRSIDVHCALTDVDLETVVPKHVLHKADDKMQHQILSRQCDSASCLGSFCAGLLDQD